MSVSAALTADALAVVAQEGDWAVRVVGIVLRARERVERLAGAVQADGKNIGVSTFERDAAVVSTSPDVLLGDAHLRTALVLLSSDTRAEVHGLILVLRIFCCELLLIPSVQKDQYDKESNDGNTAGH